MQSSTSETLRRDETTTDDESFTACPLFMVSLPSDFDINPALAALASLLENDTDEPPPSYHHRGRWEEDLVVSSVNDPSRHLMTLPTGGGRVPRTKSRRKLRSWGHPYRKPASLSSQEKATTTATKSTTVGEMQLFMKLWKL